MTKEALKLALEALEEYHYGEARIILRQATEEDDDTQVYKKPWLGLTDREMMDAIQMDDSPMEMGRKIEAKLKEKNT